MQFVVMVLFLKKKQHEHQVTKKTSAVNLWLSGCQITLGRHYYIILYHQHLWFISSYKLLC